MGTVKCIRKECWDSSRESTQGEQKNKSRRSEWETENETAGLDPSTSETVLRGAHLRWCEVMSSKWYLDWWPQRQFLVLLMSELSCLIAHIWHVGVAMLGSASHYKKKAKVAHLGAARWISSQKHELLFHRTPVQLPLPTWRLTCNSGSRGHSALFWLPRALHTCGA